MQIMILPGYDDDNTPRFPDWEYNLRLGVRIQKQLSDLHPGLARPLNFCPHQYDLNMMKGFLLVEVGIEVNTVDGTAYSGELFSATLTRTLLGLKQTPCPILCSRSFLPLLRQEKKQRLFKRCFKVKGETIVKDVKERRCFWASFLTTPYLIVLVCGIIAIGCRTARVDFGQSQPLIWVLMSEEKTSLSIHVLGAGGEWDITALDQRVQNVENVVIMAVEGGQKLLRQIPLQRAYEQAQKLLLTTISVILIRIKKIAGFGIQDQCRGNRWRDRTCSEEDR